MSTAGVQTNAIAFGGQTDPGEGTPTATQGYDGTTWSTRPNIATGRAQAGGAGTAAAGLLFGGAAQIATTEEFTGETSADTASAIDFD